jgi:hypothetical protein
MPKYRYCPAKKEGGREGYHSNRYDVACNRYVFKVDLIKGYSRALNRKKLITGFRAKKMWVLFSLSKLSHSLYHNLFK